MLFFLTFSSIDTNHGMRNLALAFLINTFKLLNTLTLKTKRRTLAPSTPPVPHPGTDAYYRTKHDIVAHLGVTGVMEFSYFRLRTSL